MSRKTFDWKLSPEEVSFFKIFAYEKKNEGAPQVLWGWKRDLVENQKVYPYSRVIYFAADLDLDKNDTLFIKSAYFFLSSRAKDDEIASLARAIGKGNLGDYSLQVDVSKDKTYTEFSRITITLGTPTNYDKKTVERLLGRRPRIVINPPHIIPEWQFFDLTSFAPFALCVGSGLSTESGLPLLGEIHDVFDVDDFTANEFIFGAKDPMPSKLAKDVNREFAKFCQFTVDAIFAQPSSSHKIIADLYRKGIVKQVFTDNMDNILQKVDLPFTQTRISIFPDRFPVKFDHRVKSLLVVGVSVDRRDVIKQARLAGKTIIAINPVLGVAPHSRNIDYLAKRDLFFRGRAEEILPKIAEYFH